MSLKEKVENHPLGFLLFSLIPFGAAIYAVVQYVEQGKVDRRISAAVQPYEVQKEQLNQQIVELHQSALAHASEEETLREEIRSLNERVAKKEDAVREAETSLAKGCPDLVEEIARVSAEVEAERSRTEAAKSRAITAEERAGECQVMLGASQKQPEIQQNALCVSKDMPKEWVGWHPWYRIELKIDKVEGKQFSGRISQLECEFEVHGVADVALNAVDQTYWRLLELPQIRNGQCWIRWETTKTVSGVCGPGIVFYTGVGPDGWYGFVGDIHGTHHGPFWLRPAVGGLQKLK